MDPKGLGVCSSLEREKACWRRGCCLDGRNLKAACRSAWQWRRSWQSYRRFARTGGTCSIYCDKPGLHNNWQPLHSCQRDNTLLKYSAHSLVWHGQLFLLTNQVSLCGTKVHQTSWGSNHLSGDWTKAPYHSPYAFSKSAGDIQIPPKFWPDLDKKNEIGSI